MEDQREIALRAWCEAQTGTTQPQLEVVSGDASFRRYFRATDGKRSLIAVDCPPEKENMQPFVDVAEAYRDAGVTVPELIAVHPQKGFMLQQDFGETLLLSKLNARSMQAFYQQALAALPNIMRVTRTATGNLEHYDAALLTREMRLFSEWLLAAHLQQPLELREERLWNEVQQRLLDNALEQPQVGVHRDYHSRNLMVLANDELGIIDFQDAVIGPITYDAVSLLRDCYVQWSAQDIDTLAQNFRELLQQQQLLSAAIDAQTWQRWFDLMGMQRHLKAAGIFARLAYRDGKQGYLQDVPRTLGYLISISQRYPEFTEFSDWLAQRVLPEVERRQ